jgi:hypothetical protein
MTVTLEEFTKDFTPQQRAQVEARAAELIAEALAVRRTKASSKPTRRDPASKCPYVDGPSRANGISTSMANCHSLLPRHPRHRLASGLPLVSYQLYPVAISGGESLPRNHHSALERDPVSCALMSDL